MPTLCSFPVRVPMKERIYLHTGKAHNRVFVVSKLDISHILTGEQGAN